MINKDILMRWSCFHNVHIVYFWWLWQKNSFLQKGFFLVHVVICKLVKLKGANFGAGPSFLDGIFSVHGDVKLFDSGHCSSHGRQVLWWFLGCCFWPSKPLSAELKVTSDFFKTFRKSLIFFLRSALCIILCWSVQLVMSDYPFSCHKEPKSYR